MNGYRKVLKGSLAQRCPKCGRSGLPGREWAMVVGKCVVGASSEYDHTIAVVEFDEWSGVVAPGPLVSVFPRR